MKIHTLLFTACSLAYGVSAKLPETPIDIAAPSLPSEEIASLEIQPLLQSSMQQPPIVLPELVEPRAYKKPWLAVTYSCLFPGLGYIYLENPEKALGYISTTSLGLSLIVTNNIESDSALEIAASTLTATSFYNVYATYRDARAYNGSFQYSYRMPQDTLVDLTLAPFKWSVIKKPEVWGGVLGFLAAGAVLIDYVYEKDLKVDVRSATTYRIPPICALPVGLGEEAFFRGFLQSALSEEFGPFTGTVVSSILFGAAHAGNASNFPESMKWRYYAFSIPFIASIGAYCGWLTHKNQSLQESVALHSWYDFILFLGTAGSEALITGRPSFAFSTSF